MSAVINMLRRLVASNLDDKPADKYLGCTKFG